MLTRVGSDAQLSLLACMQQRADDIAALQRRQIAGMKVHDVDHVGAQALQGGVDAGRDHRAGPVGHALDAVADLGGQDELAAPVREMAADALFAQAIAARGVDQRDAQVQLGVEQAPHLAFVARGIADLPRAEAEGRHLQPSAA